MIDLLDLFHYAIGLIIVSIFVGIIINTHLYFSKDNKPIMPSSQIKTN